MKGPVGKSKLGEIHFQAKLAAVTMHELRDRMHRLHLRLQAPASSPTTTPGGAGVDLSTDDGTDTTTNTGVALLIEDATDTTTTPDVASAAPPIEDATDATTTTTPGGAGAALPIDIEDGTDTDTGTTTTPDSCAAPTLEDEIVQELQYAYWGFEAVARYITTCLTMSASNGVPPSLPVRFAVISNEKLHDEMVAMRLPRRPTTQRHAFARLEAVFYAVKLPQEHHIPRCVEHLRRPAMEQARTYLGHICTFADLAVKHIDLAVTAIQSFMDDPNKVASACDFTEKYAIRYPYA